MAILVNKSPLTREISLCVNLGGTIRHTYDAIERSVGQGGKLKLVNDKTVQGETIVYRKIGPFVNRC